MSTSRKGSTYLSTVQVSKLGPQASMSTPQLLATLRQNVSSKAGNEADLTRKVVSHFNKYDQITGSGGVNAAGLRDFVNGMCNMEISEKQSEDLLQVLDANGDGRLDRQEVLAGFLGRTLPKQSEVQRTGRSRIYSTCLSNVQVGKTGPQASMSTLQLLATLRQKAGQYAASETDLTRAVVSHFNKYDQITGSGGLDAAGLRDFVNGMCNMEITEKQSEDLLEILDANGNGLIEHSEMLAGFLARAPARKPSGFSGRSGRMGQIQDTKSKTLQSAGSATITAISPIKKVMPTPKVHSEYPTTNQANEAALWQAKTKMQTSLCTTTKARSTMGTQYNSGGLTALW